MLTRKEHIEWAKKRALELCDKGDLVNALASFVSDMARNPETVDHPCMKLGIALSIAGKLSTQEEIRNFIEGIN